MLRAQRRPLTDIDAGTRAGIRTGVRKIYAGVPREPLPIEHVDLLLALRRKEREEASRRA